MATKTPGRSIHRIPTEAEIRAYAHELYVRSGWIPGRELENWREAEAWLSSHPPVEESVHDAEIAVAHRRRSPLPSYHPPVARV